MAKVANNRVDFTFRGDGQAINVTQEVALWRGRITGGTGVFAGAAGTMMARAILEPGVDRFTLRITLRAARP